MSEVQNENSMFGRGVGEVMIARCRAWRMANARVVSYELSLILASRMYSYGLVVNKSQIFKSLSHLLDNWNLTDLLFDNHCSDYPYFRP